MKLVKGDKDNLEGRAVVYAKFKGNRECEGSSENVEDGTIFALYASTDIIDFLDKIGTPKEVSSTLGELINGFTEAIKIVPVYLSPIDIDSEADLLDAPEDILFTGEYSTPERCRRSVVVGVLFYFLQMEEQINKKTGIDSSCEQGTAPATYKDFIGDDIQNHIMQNYIIPMIDAANYGEQGLFERVRGDFVRFSAGSPFVNDTLRLCKLIKQGGKRQNTELIEAYVGKITAVHTEEYEVAAGKRDVIDRLEGQNKTS